MAVSSNLYQSAIDKAFAGLVNYPTDTIKMALLTSAYTPNLATHANFSDLTNETTGTGYTAGGATLGTKTHVATAANSWATAAATTTAYNAGDVVRPAVGNGFLYVAVVGGTSGGVAPTWPTTVGATVVDGGVTWANIGESITVWSSAAASWSGATFSAAYGVIYDAQSGVAATEPLIALINFGQTLSPVAGTLTVTPPALGWWWTSPA